MKVAWKKTRDSQDGSIVLEACFSVLIFILFVLAMYGLLTVFMAQSLIGHALVESTQSLALDSYATNKLTSVGKFNVGEDVVRPLLELVTDFEPEDPHFSSRERWFDRENGATREDWEEAAKLRFVGYLTGSGAAAGEGGKETAKYEARADEILKALRVVDGLDGLDFSESDVVGNDLYVRVRYKVAYLYNPFGLEGLQDLTEFDTTQQACSRMWGASLIDTSEATEDDAGGGAD